MAGPTAQDINQIKEQLENQLKSQKAEKEKITDNTEEIIKNSGGAVKKASEEEVRDMNSHRSPYVNKFLCSVLRNNMVHLGFSLENNDSDSSFTYAIVTDIQCIANLQVLLSQVLTQFQQHQMRAMQELQSKVNPQFAEQMRLAQEAKKN